MRLAFVALVAVALFACAPSTPTESLASPSRTVSPSPVPTEKVDPTPSPVSFDPRFVRVLWMYMPQLQRVVFQEDDRAGTIVEMRIVRVADRMVMASGVVRRALPGEPRVCGHPDVAPPLVAGMLLTDAVLADLRRAGGPQEYRLEVQTADLSWFAVELLDWTKIAGGPCFS